LAAKDTVVLSGSETFNMTFTLAGVTIETLRFIGVGNDFEGVNTVDEVK
jgi:hypothetical protein